MDTLEHTEEGVAVSENKEYPHCHGEVYTPLQNLTTITEKGVEVCNLIVGHFRGDMTLETEHAEEVGPIGHILCTVVFFAISNMSHKLCHYDP